MPKVLKIRDLVLLGLLMDQARYGYEVKVLLDNALTHLVNINSGSLYYRLKQLQKQGYVHEVAVEKIGRRPERSIYQLTELGRRAFLEGVEQQLYPAVGSFDPLDLALYFINVLDLPTIIHQLAKRRAMLRQLSESIYKLLNTAQIPMEPCHHLIIQHKRMVIDMEILYLDKLLHELTGGRNHLLSEQDNLSVNESASTYMNLMENGIWADKELRLSKLE